MTGGSAAESAGGRYRLEHRVASGSSADVWRATDLQLSRSVAVKVLHYRLGHDTGTLDRFRKSASCTASLIHEGIARVFDYGEPDPADSADSADSAERPFLVMEFVNGQSLAELLAAEPFDAARAMDVTAQAAAALDAAHQAGCVHGAVGPENILLGPDDRVKLIGFGAGHRAGGVPGSAAGDLAAGDLAASDLYALGMVAQLCLTGGEVPGDGVAPALPDQTPAPVTAFIGQLTAQDPSARPATAAEVSREAARLHDQLAPASPPSPAIPENHGVGELSLATQQALGIADRMSPTAMVPNTQRRKRRAAATRRRRSAAMPTFAVVALALTAAALFVVLNPGRSAPQIVGTTNLTTVRVDAHSLTGQPVRGVRQRLERLGLLVRVRWQPNDQVSPGKVLYVWPAGSVPAHSLITLIGAIPPPDVTNTAPVAGWVGSPAPHRHLARPAGDGPAIRQPHPTPSASPTGSPVPSRTPSASPSPSGDPSPSTSSSPPTSPPPSGSPSPSRSVRPRLNTHPSGRPVTGRPLPAVTREPLVLSGFVGMSPGL